jgi:DNA polymerase III delta prime subunit
MAYSFSNLSPADFEDLTRDLVGRELGIRFEAFSAGPDGGVDGRHAVGKKSIVMQAKHYVASRFPALKAAMKRERDSIDRFKPRPKRYLLATSRGLTQKNKAALAGVIGPVLNSERDIFGAEDLSGLLRKFPDIEKANIKLWLSSAAVLERVIRSAAYAFTAISRAEIESRVRVYAQNPSFKEARDKLESNHVVIISGPPGIGKTTLAEMLSYAYIGEEWEFVAIRSLDDGLAAIVDAKKQVFFFDDFLGKVALDTRALATKDSDLARFIRRVRAAPNARFILTTRSPIFEEARRVSEHLADTRLDILRYVLDVGIYTRRIRARILYNHLFVSGMSIEHIKALWDAGAIAKIVDHKNYNPRIIEAMTHGMHTREVGPDAYPKAFLNALNNPRQLWDTAFRTHIPAKCRHLLFSLFFCSEYGVEIDELRGAFEALHPLLCHQYNIAQDIKDFEEALKILEGGFVSISSGRVTFINPSVRDYLTDYLDDAALLGMFAKAAQKADWAEAVWRHATKAAAKSAEQQRALGAAFKAVAQLLPALPVMKRDPVEPNRYRFYDSSMSNRLSLLLELYVATSDIVFSGAALSLADQRSNSFSSWSDGANLVRLVRSLRAGSYDDLPFAVELADKLESVIIGIFESVWADDLGTMWDAIESARDVLAGEVFDAARNAVVREVEEARSSADATDSESTLDDHIKTLERLAPQAGVPATKLAHALSLIQERIAEINERTEEAPAPAFSGRSPREVDRFDDDALRNLFAPLVGNG